MAYNTNDLIRFLDAQNKLYLVALSEIQKGKKESPWMWFIFPQIKGLGSSDTSKFYEIKNADEALAYFEHPILGKHLVEVASELIKTEGKTADDIFGMPDDENLQSSMTLFASIQNSESVFQDVLNKYFGGASDFHTLQLLYSNL
ncbi:calpastatin [Flavobacterium sp. IR1]|nr:calpastatin [Flavobacterium sp. IR1]